jgi:hypothetical protein
MDCDTDEMIVDDVAAPLPQATQMYGAANEDDEKEPEIDEAVRRAPIWQATQQYGESSAGDDAEGDDDEAARRCGWPDAWMAGSSRGLAARWLACGPEMEDELTGESSAAREEAECMSEMAPDDAHDELMCSMDVVAEVHAQDAEREQQREGASVGCVMPNGDGAGGDGGEVGRVLECDDGGSMGREGFDVAEQGVSMAAREVEGSDEDEAMTGKENASMQRAEGCSSSIGGIKKGKRTRGKQKNGAQRQAAARAVRRLAADGASGN